MLPAMNPRKRHAELCREIERHDHLYYVLDRPAISDRQYDALFRELKQLEREHPELVTGASPTQRVGEKPREGVAKLEHAVPMFSLDNTYDEQALREFDRRVRESLPSGARPSYVAEPKLDGASLEIIYRDGALHRGITRGDGRVGEDVTANVRTIRSLPLRIDEKRPLSLRGEVVIFQRDLESVNEQRASEGEEPFANPRNAAAGSLRLLDSKLTAQRPLRVYLYELVERHFPTHEQALGAMAEMGLPTHRLHRLCRDLGQVLQYIEWFDSERVGLPYETDGVVVKVNELEQRELLGSTARFPRWAIAYKYAAERAATRVKGIECDVGRTGALTPVAVLQSVHLAGTTVSRASLHNMQYVADKDVRVGDTVTVEKAGQIIPQVLEVDRSLRPAGARAWKPPGSCPACGQKVSREGEEVALRCTNRACPGRVKASILYFTRRGGMEIDHLGRSLVEQLVDGGLVRDTADIFALGQKRAELVGLERLGKKSVDNLLAAVEQARSGRTLAQLLTALGIPLVGEVAAAALAERFGTLENLLDAEPEQLGEQLGEVHGIGPKIAQSVADWFGERENRRLLGRMLELGVRPRAPESESRVAEGPLRGSSFCITGVLSRPRQQIQQQIRAAGGEVHERVTGKTTYLVAGEKVGDTKIKSAKKHGARVIDEAGLRELLQGREPDEE
jgi:DNA ligase (NAD+)